MTLDQILGELRPAILARWSQALLAGYPAQALRHLTNEPDPFANPVGGVVREGIEELYQRLRSPDQPAGPALERLVRLLSLQGTPPSQTLSFLLAVKPLLRAELAAREPERWRELDDRLDQLAIELFDLFTACREELLELRLAELQRRTSKLLERLQPGSR